MDFHLDSLLNLPKVTVISYQRQEGYIILKLEFWNENNQIGFVVFVVVSAMIAEFSLTIWLLFKACKLQEERIPI